MAKFTLKELRQKRRAGEKLGPKQLARLQNARANRQTSKAASEPNIAQGALAQSPNINPKTNKPYKLTIKELQARQAAGKNLRPLQERRLREAGLYQEPEPAPIQTLAPEQQFERIGGQASSGVEQFMQQIQQQGAFQPGSYQDMMNQAYQNVMNQYEMTQAPEFERQQAQFQQMAAERGLDPNSEAYKTMQQQLNQRQDFARQSAMAQAQQQAQGVQAQGFNQALQQYQSPTAMLGAFSPFYSQFGQQQQFKTQAELQREQMANQLAMQRMSSGATLGAAQAGQYGKLSPEQQFELQRMRNEGAIRLEEMRQGAPFDPLPQSNSGYNYMQGAAQGVAGYFGS